jgi:agmatinase
MEGLLRNDSNIHAGIRTTLSGPSDYENDGYCGFEIVEAREVDKIGTDGIIKKIIDRVGTTNPVYLSLDIDTLDPAFAPATGTPETGGWSTRELRTILRGLEGINLIAADIVEVAVSPFCRRRGCAVSCGQRTDCFPYSLRTIRMPSSPPWRPLMRCTKS